MKKEYLYSILLFVVGIVVFVINLGANTVDIMEARNFVTVREILQSGDWLHPTMNGELRLEKPPLPTWITAVFATLFGLKNLFFLRLPAALMAIWMLFSMQALVQRLIKNNLLAFLSALSLAGMLYVILLGRRGTWDIYTHSFMLAAIVQILALFQCVNCLWRGLWGGLLFGAAFLSKGPVALYAVFLPFVIAYFFYRKHFFTRQTCLAIFAFVVMAVLISGSWFAFIHLTYGDETHQILSKEVANWHSYNVRPWYYYLKDYPVHSGFWAAILAMGLLTPYTYRKSNEKNTYKFFWIWTVCSVILLSLIPEKKIRYLLPTFIPAAFLVGSYLYYLLTDFYKYAKRIDRNIFYLHWGLFVVAAVALLIGVNCGIFKKIFEVKTVILIEIFIILSIFFFIKTLTKRDNTQFILGVMLLLTSGILLLRYSDGIANKKYHSIEEVQQKAEFATLPCYAMEETRIELVWLIGRKIKEVQTTENLQPPYLLLTDKLPENYLTTQDFEVIGQYDNNSKPQGHKHYRESLTKYVSAVR